MNWRRQVEDELAEEQAEYEALQAEILDAPGGAPQGLHRGGWKPFGDPEAWEGDAVDDYSAPSDWDDS